MESLQCEAVLLAAEQGSLTAAAERLDYTQSGITRMISSLEEELGFPLFIRSRRGVRLTENGKEMLPLFRELRRAQQRAEQSAAEIRGIVSGSLTIGCYYSISAMWMPEILKRFKKRYPKIIIRLREGGNEEMSHWLGERSVDCCLGAEPRRRDCDWIPIFRDELVVWLPRKHPLAGEASFPLERLTEEDFIHTAPDQDTDQDRLLSRYGIRPHSPFSTRDGFATYNMVEAGLGISFNQRLISKRWKGEVAELPFSPPQYVTLGISLPSLRDASPAAKRLIDCVSETMGEQFWALDSGRQTT